MAPDVPLDVYAAPSPHLAYSPEFFNKLTIAKLAALEFPTLAPEGSVTLTEFLPEVPRSAAATVIRPNEILPNYADLVGVTRHLTSEYQNGMRAVRVTFQYLEIEYCYIYHFSKVCEILSITQLRTNIRTLS